MELDARGSSRLRCPYCHGPLALESALHCLRCTTPAHLGCIVEHGGCPILGCEPAPPVRLLGADPTRVPWEEFVEQARPWLEVGAGLIELEAWEAIIPPSVTPALDDEDPLRSGSSSGSRAA